MADPKSDLDAEVASLTELARRVEGLALSDEDRELLGELVGAHIAAVRQAWVDQRLEQAISLLFPTYNGRLPEDEKPVRWPEKAWWWNGASVTDVDELHNGDLRVTVRSYVGGGETDELTGLVIPRAWLDAPNMPSVIHEACRFNKRRRDGAARERDLAIARSEVAQAAARLQALTGASNA